MFCVHCLVDGMRGKYDGRNLPRAKQDINTVWNAERGTLISTIDDTPKLGQSAEWLADGSGRLRLKAGLFLHLVQLPSGKKLGSNEFPYDSHSDNPAPRIVPGGTVTLTNMQDKLVAWNIDEQRLGSTLCDSRLERILVMDSSGTHCVLRTPDAGTFVVRIADGKVVKQLGEQTEMDAVRVFGARSGDAVAFAGFGASGSMLALVT